MHDENKEARRRPQQERSVARVVRMLDTCAVLLEEVGYEGLSTTLLAERAGVAIGSVYQFFTDKRAVVYALAHRNLDTFLRRAGVRLTDGQASGELPTWQDGVEAVAREYIQMHRDTIGFRVLGFGDRIELCLLAGDCDNNAILVDRLLTMLGEQFVLACAREIEFTLTIVVEIADALITLAFCRDPDGDPDILDEALTIIRDRLHTSRRAPDGKPDPEPGPSAPVVVFREPVIERDARAPSPPTANAGRP